MEVAGSGSQQTVTERRDREKHEGASLDEASAARLSFPSLPPVTATDRHIPLVGLFLAAGAAPSRSVDNLAVVSRSGHENW